MRREQQPDQDANKNETDIPPGLGGTNVRFPSKFLNNIYLVRGFFLLESTTFKMVEKLLQKKMLSLRFHATCFDTIFGFVSHSISRLLTT